MQEIDLLQSIFNLMIDVVGAYPVNAVFYMFCLVFIVVLVREHIINYIIGNKNK